MTSAVVLMSPALRSRIFAAPDWERLEGLLDIEHVGAAVPPGESKAEIAITGWDTEPLSDDASVLPALRFVAHTGGSVRAILPRSLFHRGVRVIQVAAVIAEGVAEFAVMAIIAGLRDAPAFATDLANGEPWNTSRPLGRLLQGSTVGIVGASRTGIATIHRLRPFGCTILVADPLLSAADALALGVERSDLDDLCARSHVVSLHAPVLPTTVGMIGRAQVAAMQPGTVLVNTARAALIDEHAVLAAARAGAIRVITDVFPSEPLPLDSEWRRAPGVTATPHIAALTRETLHAQGRQSVDEIERFLSSAPLAGEIVEADYDHIA